MPNIREINNDKLGLTASERGVDAYTQSARRIVGIFGQVADDQRRTGNTIASAIEVGGKTAVDYLDHQEISHGMAQFAQLHLNLTKQWDDVLKGADPNDPAVAAKFRDSVVEPALEKFSEGFSTEKSQAWAESRTGALRDHFFTKTAADQSSLAMVATRENVRTLANTYSTSVAIDPSSTREVLKQARDDLNALVDTSPTLSAEHRAQVKGEIGQKISESIVKAGVTAAIAKNPDAGLALARDPELAPYLNGGEVNQFYGEAKRAAKADEVNARQLATLRAKDTSEKNSEAILEDIHGDNPTWTAQKILQLPADQLSYERRKDLVGAIEKRDKPNTAELTRATQAEAGRMIVDIHNGKLNNPDDVYKAVGEGKLDWPRAKEVLKELNDVKSPGGETLKQARADFMKQYGGVVNPYKPGDGRSEDGYKREYQLQQFSRQREAEMLASGKDPHTLYDPRSPDFLGNTPYARVTASADLLKRGSYDHPTVDEGKVKGPLEFGTEKDAMDAEKAGTLKKGSKVIIGGKRGTWQ